MADTNKNVSGEVDGLKEGLRAGVWVFFMLAVITAGEFLVAVIAPPWLWAIAFAALFKAFYVIKDYMHIGRLFSDDEETH